MIAHSESMAVQRWRRRIGKRHRYDAYSRPLAALGYLATGPVIQNLIEIKKLMLVVLHDEPIRNGVRALRLAGFTGAAVPWGARWGGPGQSVLYKDLRLRPMLGARGLRLDAGNTELFDLGLALERVIHQYASNRIVPAWNRFQLPRLWACFRPTDAVRIDGDGPELERASRRQGIPPQALFRKTARAYFGLTLYPLEWVSHEWQRAVGVFVDMEGFPTRQVIRMTWPGTDLVGCHDATQYDFYHSRFREYYHRCLSRVVS